MRLIDADKLRIYFEDDEGNITFKFVPFEFIDSAPTIDAVPVRHGEIMPYHWISVSDRLPEAKKKHYWVCTDTGYQCECRWTNNRFGLGESDEWGWSVFDIPQYSHVIAWMELPEPYKGERNENIQVG